MDRAQVSRAIALLGEQFPLYDWTYRAVPGTGGTEVGFEWYGGEDEDVMVCAHVGRELHERFHRHGFFFFNYAYQGSYEALSHNPNNLITVEQGQMYVGQPFSGYALHGNTSQDIVIMGVLVRTQTFYREFLPLMMGNQELLEFFLGPRDNLFSDEFMQVTMPDDSGARDLIELMAVEYALRRETAQPVLKPLALALAEVVAREWQAEHPQQEDDSVSRKVVDAISRDLAHASIKDLARQLGYHPNYLSTLVHKETGKTFSQLVLEQRMERAGVLVERTTLPVEEISRAVGYSSTSNFYKAYQRYFGHSPRRRA